MDLKKELRIIVKYMLPPEDRDKDVVENYVDTLALINEEYVKQLSIPRVVGSALLKDLLDGSEEVIAINGLRFTGTHEEKIKQVFNKHGIKYETPF